MDERLTFNEDAINYEKWRPTYCKKLFDDIIQYSKLDKSKKVVEVGIGTGQATTPFLMTGCSLTAVEVGKNLADYSKEKFKRHKNFNICNTSFEDFYCDDSSIDLLYSATAFHWIPEEIGYSKAFKLLKSGGTLALFWNKPFVAREDDILHRKIQSIYQKYKPLSSKLIENDTSRYAKISETIKLFGFKDLKVHLYHGIRKFNSSDYISLLNTYSGHRAMPEFTKQLFESEIEYAIIEYGNVLNVYDTIDLYLARKV